MEEYQIIKDFPNYEISNCGNLRNKNTSKILKCRKDKDGYLRTNIYNDEKPKTVNIHRLVATTFIENTNNKPIIDHIDRNILNNNVSNLRWCDVSENTINSKLYSTNTSKNKGVSFSKNRNKFQVSISVEKKTVFGGYYDTLEEAINKRRDLEKIYYKNFIPIN
jgi:hypothetical protein